MLRRISNLRKITKWTTPQVKPYKQRYLNNIRNQDIKKKNQERLADVRNSRKELVNIPSSEVRKLTQTRGATF